MGDNPDDPRFNFKARREPPAIFKFLGAKGDETPVLGLLAVLTICGYIWYSFSKFIKDDAAKTKMLIKAQAKKIREAEDKLEIEGIRQEEKAKREQAGLPTEASAYKNSTNDSMRDVKGAPKDVL